MFAVSLLWRHRKDAKQKRPVPQDGYNEAPAPEANVGPPQSCTAVLCEFPDRFMCLGCQAAWTRRSHCAGRGGIVSLVLPPASSVSEVDSAIPRAQTG